MLRRWYGKLAVTIVVLAAYYVIGHWIVDPRAEAPIFEEARCKRAALNAAKGLDYDPQLLEECRRKGIIPEVTTPKEGN